MEKFNLLQGGCLPRLPFEVGDPIYEPNQDANSRRIRKGQTVSIECEFHFYCDWDDCGKCVSNYDEVLPDGWIDHSDNEDLEERHFCCDEHAEKFYEERAG